MTPADQLRSQARQLLALADKLDTGALQARPADEAPRLIDTSTAMRLARKSSSWCYSNARKFGFGHRLASGSWTYDEALLRLFLAGRRSVCEENDAASPKCELIDDVVIHTITTSN